MARILQTDYGIRPNPTQYSIQCRHQYCSQTVYGKLNYHFMEKGEIIMAKYNNSGNVSAIKTVSIEARNSEKVAEVNRGLTDLKSEILKQKIMLQALMEIMAEQGIDPERINAKIEEVVSRPETFNPTKRDTMPCPSCGKNVIDNGNTPLTGTCLYCGQVVRFNPHFSIGKAEEPEQAQEQEPIQEPTQDPLF